tara:strand:- start:346 stop:573 length:228 start_codon:yes stop_codon:yes gene_type:complete
MKLWFKSKKYGWGWTPCSIEGWLVTLGFIGIVFFLARYFLEQGKTVAFIEGLIVSILIFIVIAWKTGEKPKFSWG